VPETTTYRLAPSAIPLLRRRVLVRTILLGGIAGGTGMAIAVHLLPIPAPAIILVVGLTVLGLAGAASGSLFLALALASEGWRTFELSISQDCVVRRQANLPDLILPSSEVTSIIERRDGAMVIRGATIRRVVGIPAGIERREELRRQLASWGPIRPPRGMWESAWTPIAAGALTMALLAVTMLSTRPVVVVSAACLLSAFLLWAFVEIRRSASFDQRVKHRAWMFFLVIGLLAVRAAVVCGLFR
jgi:hypothetical protein